MITLTLILIGAVGYLIYKDSKRSCDKCNKK